MDPIELVDTPELQSKVSNLSRRHFLGAAGGLVLGWHVGPAIAAAAAGNAPASTPSLRAAQAAPVFVPNAFIRIGNDGVVTVMAKHVEMGQGSYTGLATLAAEELDADWSKVRVEGAPADVKLYANLLLKIYQGTAGSSGMANSFEQMRTAGATARAMLVAAAARKWGVPAQEIVVENSIVRHDGSRHRAGFGELAPLAAVEAVPTQVKLKSPTEFKLIGKKDLHRVDTRAKTDGSAIYTQDMKLPGMLVAVAAHPTRFGSTLKSFDAGKARAVPGVVDVVAFAGTPHSFPGVAVLATNTWAARKGRDALIIEWDDTKGYKGGSAEILAHYRETSMRPGPIARKDGDVDAVFAGAGKVIEAEYIVPFLAHAAMEPMNCLVQLGDDSCEIWNGEQWQTVDQESVGKFLGIAPEKVKINQLFAGGSFGRRANPQSDYLVEAVSIASAARSAGRKGPVKLVWTREDDMRGGYYRPINLHRAKLALDADGKLIAWQQRLVGQSIRRGTFLANFNKNGIDTTSVDGVTTLPYDIPNLQVELHSPEDVDVPVQWFRSVGQSQNGFSVEGLVDEAAVLAGADPLAFRRGLLAKSPRHIGVLDLAAEKSGWDKPLKPGAAGERRGRGVAVIEAFRTCVAQVAEVTVKADGSVRVDRIVCAVDCGLAINPDVVKAQMEGGIGFGLSAALHGEITLEDGVVQQSNFHQYRVLRMNEMPAIEVYIVASGAPPSGVGEPGVPATAPAVVNAIFNATGQRLRTLPIGTQLRPATT